MRVHVRSIKRFFAKKWLMPGGGWLSKSEPTRQVLRKSRLGSAAGSQVGFLFSEKRQLFSRSFNVENQAHSDYSE